MRIVIRYFFKTVRLVLTPFLLIGNRLTLPKGVERSREAQAEVDRRTAPLSLYQFRSCPFCIKTRRAIARLSLDIETRDALGDPAARQELESGGGEVKVPCLRIEKTDGTVEWMYESDDIIAYLEREFAAA